MAKKLVYGSVAVWRGTRKGPDDQRTHKWTAYVRGHNDEDISYFVKRVQFDLHPSFEDHIKIIESAPFEISETGWGEFEMKIKVFFVEVSGEKPIEFTHYLKLYGSQATIQSAGGSLRPSFQAQNVPKKLPVVVEKYDEILFVDPTEAFYEILQQGSQIPPEQVRQVSVSSEIKSHGTQFLESREVPRLEEAKNRLKAQIAQLKDKHQQEEEVMQRLIHDTESLQNQIKALQEPNG